MFRPLFVVLRGAAFGYGRISSGENIDCLLVDGLGDDC